MKKSWSKYYARTKELSPSKFLIETLKSFNREGYSALDLGCGAGRDTGYLLERGYDVTAVDKYPAAESYIKQLSHQEKLNFVCIGFEDFCFSHYDLVNAHYSLPFTKKGSFDKVMKEVTNSIKPNGLFVGQLFGVGDEWNTSESEINFCERKDIEKFFYNFKLLKISEINETKRTANGSLKYWHVFNVIAQK